MMLLIKLLSIMLLFVLLPILIYFYFLKKSLWLHKVPLKLLPYLKAFILFIPFTAPLYFVFTHLYRIEFLITLFSYLFSFHIAASMLLFTYLIMIQIIRFIHCENWRRWCELLFLLAILPYNFLLIYFAFSAPEIVRYEITAPNYNLSNYRIVFVSDLHLGPLLKENWLKEKINVINPLSPNLVLLGGDIVDLPANLVKPYVKLLKSFKASDGVVPILGNHEYYQGAEPLIELFKEEGLPFLINDSIQIKSEKGELTLIGIADPSGKKRGGPPPDFTILPKIAGTTYKIAMIHQPKMAPRITDHANLILSGHTHGGQIFPFGAIAKLQQNFLEGEYDLSNMTKLIVSRGLGFWGPPVRFYKPGEIVLITINP